MHINKEIPQEIRDLTKRVRERVKADELRVKSDAESGGLTFIEQLTELSELDCEAYEVPFFFRMDETEQKIEFRKGSCKMWSCKACGARNAKRWIARVIDGCNKLEAEHWYFATITAHRHWRGSVRSLENLRNNWQKLKQRLERLTAKQGEKHFYVRVWEAHKDGSFHMHVITNAQVDTRWLKDNAAQCGLGYQAKIDEAVNAGQVAGYISKYMLKAMPNATHYPKGARRIEVSQSWVKWHEKDTDWRVVYSFEQAKGMSKNYKNHGWSVFDLAIKNENKRRKEMNNEQTILRDS